jgi:NADH:ubiquinone oxidoreductase subunit 4 (subunit M)
MIRMRIGMIYAANSPTFAILALYLGSEPNIFDMREIIASPPLGGVAATLALVAMLVTFFVKTPVFPVHTWLPAAHVEAPTAGSVVLAGVLLKLGTYGLVRFALQMTPEAFRELAPAVAGFAVFSALYGAFVALAQTDLKRLVAYTSVNHMGYVVLGVAVAAAATDPGARTLALDGATLQMVSHGVVTGALFGATGSTLLTGPARLIIARLDALSMTYGNLAALVQDNVVRLLAYSSIAQSGYFLLGVVALGQSGLAISSLVIFAAAYAAMNLGAFAVVMVAGRTLQDFAGLGRSRPATDAAIVIFLISLVGVPPLAGFVGKLLLFGAAMDAGFVWLAVVAILNSVLSLAVYLRIVVPMYGRPKGPDPARLVTAVWALALVATVGIGVAAQVLLGWVA